MTLFKILDLAMHLEFKMFCDVGSMFIYKMKCVGVFVLFISVRDSIFFCLQIVSG